MLSDTHTKLFVMYNNQKCLFIPNNDYSSFNEIKGKVVYIERGAYNPSGWYRDIVVSKKDIFI